MSDIPHNPHSAASIAGHPIHPMLVPFPIAFFVAALICDLVFWQNSNAAWVTASVWLLGGGLVTAVLAALAGLADVLGDGRVRNLSTAWLHAAGNIIIVLVELSNWYLRFSTGDVAVVPTGLILSLIAVAGLLFTGWLGGELVYRHRVGVSEPTKFP